jgi:acetyl/propionyl-CoA carboxylase alpha subunit
MLAKVICWGATRNDAIERMLRALQEYVIVGIQSNIPFHMQLLRDKRFLRGAFHTNWLDQEFTMESPDGHPDEHVALLVAAVLAHRRRRQGARVADAGATTDGGSVWRFAGRDRLLASRSLTQRSGWRRSTG